MDGALIIDFVVAVISSTYNFLYIVRHKNGKSLIRLFSAVILGVFATLYGMALLNVVNPQTFGPEYIRPLMGPLLILPTLDAMVDWKSKQ